jgi:hypothetical protein
MIRIGGARIPLADALTATVDLLSSPIRATSALPPLGVIVSAWPHFGALRGRRVGK